MIRTLLAVVLATAIAGGSEPRINSVQPEKIAVSAKAQQVTVVGEDFRAGLTLVVTTPAGAPRSLSGSAIAGLSATTFRTSIAFDAVGPYELVVMNTDGGKSSPFRIDVRAAAPAAAAPVIERIQPAEIGRSQETQVLTLRGSGFQTGMKLNLTDPTGTVSVRDVFDRLEPTIAVVRLVFEVSGTYGLSVTNPGGRVSNSVSITIR